MDGLATVAARADGEPVLFLSYREAVLARPPPPFMGSPPPLPLPLPPQLPPQLPLTNAFSGMHSLPPIMAPQPSQQSLPLVLAQQVLQNQQLQRMTAAAAAAAAAAARAQSHSGRGRS